MAPQDDGEDAGAAMNGGGALPLPSVWDWVLLLDEESLVPVAAGGDWAGMGATDPAGGFASRRVPGAGLAAVAGKDKVPVG